MKTSTEKEKKYISLRTKCATNPLLPDFDDQAEVIPANENAGLDAFFHRDVVHDQKHVLRKNQDGLDDLSGYKYHSQNFR
jgi:hypothetical protein